MEKQTKDKKDTPQSQSWDKTNRNFQRTGNEEDVHGELAIRGNSAKAHQKKQHDPGQPKKNDKQQSS